MLERIIICNFKSIMYLSLFTALNIGHSYMGVYCQDSYLVVRAGQYCNFSARYISYKKIPRYYYLLQFLQKLVD